MNTRQWFGITVGSLVVWWTLVATSQEPPPANSTTIAAATEAKSPASATLARDQAKLMHKVYSATLDVLHQRYFRNDRDTVPARAMEDVFSEMKRQTKIQARWVGVNAKTLSIDHEPKDDFEKLVAKALGRGEESVERIEGKLFRRAEAIPFSSDCLACHGTFGIEPKTPRVAALVIGIPINE